MISQTSEELIVAAPPGVEKTSKQDLRPRKLSGRTFDFLRRRNSRRETTPRKKVEREDVVDVRIVECNVNNAVPTKMSFNFFKNIKKHMQFKKLTAWKFKRKENEIHVPSSEDKINCNSLMFCSDNPVLSTEENNLSENEPEGIVEPSDNQNNDETATSNNSSFHTQEAFESLHETLDNYSDTDTELSLFNAQDIDELRANNKCENIVNPLRSCSSNQEQQSGYNLVIRSRIREHQIANFLGNVNINETISNDNKVKANLTMELLKLSNYGWYWGPISGTEADAKLISEPDGAFLVRDSSDDRHVLTLSFKSSGKLLHTRMEHSGGLFSLCNQSESEGFSSVADLIDYSMNFSQSAVICYSRPKYPGHPSFPVRLTKPNTRLDNIHKLPLPNTIKGYIEEAHY
ncbi:Suppressor of cytokine signaling 6 [Dufourea novaeangliae]|uniref:Suppressor of cytokine signaling 6 n=1 Tax=Dufourea novaeangliae TaxID=178035 RepID=A0A154P157_DUFNO|nr:Suppressor of cytokine signaling 6 [Dufourea novaeangliae]